MSSFDPTRIDELLGYAEDPDGHDWTDEQWHDLRAALRAFAEHLRKPNTITLKSTEAFLNFALNESLEEYEAWLRTADDRREVASWLRTKLKPNNTSTNPHISIAIADLVRAAALLDTAPEETT